MPRVRKQKTLDLTVAFTDSEGNIYTKASADSLITWVRMTQSAPEDLGPFNLGPTYSNSPTVQTVRFGLNEYPEVEAIESDDKFASVSLAAKPRAIAIIPAEASHAVTSIFQDNKTK